MASLNVNVQDANNLTVQVTPPARQTIQINRGVPGPNSIGGYPINISGGQNYDVLMLQSNEWTNVPQTEIADGGNF
jgi:hypothetical protein